MADAPITDITLLKTFGAEMFGGANNGPWRQGGNAFGATGVLGTTDAFDMTIIAKGIQVFSSDGTTTELGGTTNPNAFVQIDGAGTGGIALNTTAGANIQVQAAGSLALDAVIGPVLLGTNFPNVATLVGSLLGTSVTNIRAASGGLSLLTALGGQIALTANGGGGVSFKPGATGFVDILPRAGGAGNTSQLRFFDLGGINNISFRSVDILVASLQFRLPPADAIAANARAALLTNAAGDLFFGNSIQSGKANIVNGVTAPIPANITAASLIFCQAADVVPGAGNLTIDYRPLAAGRVIGTPGSFTITAVLAAGTINVLDQSLGIQWLVLNP